MSIKYIYRPARITSTRDMQTIVNRSSRQRTDIYIYFHVLSINTLDRPARITSTRDMQTIVNRSSRQRTDIYMSLVDVILAGRSRVFILNT